MRINSRTDRRTDTSSVCSIVRKKTSKAALMIELYNRFRFMMKIIMTKLTTTIYDSVYRPMKMINYEDSEESVVVVTVLT